MRSAPRHPSWRSGPASMGVAALVLAVGCSGRPETGAPADSKAPLLSGTPAAPACASPDCNPGGAHAKHAAFLCQTCHKMHGPSRFDPAGPAVVAPTPANPTPAPPTFDAATVTCSNVACHGVPAGTFSYYAVDGSGEAVLTTVSYGGALRTTPSWYATGAAVCTACHDDPPGIGSSTSAWHSGYHGGQGPTGTRNQCQFCHPDASSPGNGIGDTITNRALHADGAVNVQASFTSACFSCH